MQKNIYKFGVSTTDLIRSVCQRRSAAGFQAEIFQGNSFTSLYFLAKTCGEMLRFYKTNKVLEL